METAVVFTGEGIDLIDDVPSAGEIVIRMVSEAEYALASAAAHVV
jgi:NAD(P)H-dependent flavin oxidoreductase YrpB (nitropropane dioxygenase family)